MAEVTKAAKVSTDAPASEEIEHQEGAQLTGTVKKWMQDKGYGFLSPDDGSTDVFCHSSVIQQEGIRELVEGEHVRFTLKKEGDGRLKAADVTGPDGGNLKGDWTEEELSSVQTGTVARWRGDKGFGFIKPTDGEKDIFAHVNETGVALTEGTDVEYISETQADGRFKALKVKALGGRPIAQPVQQPMQPMGGPMRGAQGGQGGQAGNMQALQMQQMQAMQMMRMRQMQQMQMMQQQGGGRYQPY